MNGYRGRTLREEYPRGRQSFLSERPKLRRILSAYTDLAAAAAVVSIIIVLVFALMGISYPEWSVEYVRRHRAVPVFPMAGAFAVFLLKDVLPLSPGKALFGLRIAENGAAAPLWKRIVRNVTIIIWPVEAAVLLLGRQRLCDRILGLEVIPRAGK